eukprot:3397799-Rhodomonas_salina.1
MVQMSYVELVEISRRQYSSSTERRSQRYQLSLCCYALWYQARISCYARCDTKLDCMLLRVVRY